MRWNIVKSLIEVDLLQSNRQMQNNGNTAKMEKKNVYWRLFLQNGSIIFIFVLLFGAALSNVPLAEYPGIFTESIGMMVIFSLLQLFQLIYNLFFQDEHLSDYLALPFSLSELFTSKIMTVFLNSIAYFTFPALFITLLGQQTGHSVILSAAIGLLSALNIMLVTTLLIFIVLHFINQTTFFRKHKKPLTIFIYLILFGSVFYMLYNSNAINEVSTEVVQDPAINPLFIGFHDIFIPGSRGEGWLKIGLWILAGISLIYLVVKRAIPQLYFEEKQPQTTTIKNKVSKKKTKSTSSAMDSKLKVFMKYQLRQLQDTSLILQMLFSKFYLPIFMIGPLLFSEATIDFSVLSVIPHLWGIFLLIGFVLSFVMMSETSISGVIISFDKENYDYIQSLPISFRRYLTLKFLFAFAIEWVLNLLVVAGVSFFIRLGIYPTLLLVVGLTSGTYIFSLYYYMRDYRLLNLSWTNFTELMQRGVGQMVRTFVQILIVFIGTLLIFGFVFWAIFILPDNIRFLVSVGIVLFIAIVTFGMSKYAGKNFWVKFNA